MKVSELQGDALNYWVARALGWVRTGDNDHCKPKHKPSLDYPGTMIDDWGSKGPHPRLVSPEGEEFYLCECDKGLGALPDFSGDWERGGPIIERERITVVFTDYGKAWDAYCKPLSLLVFDCEAPAGTGPTPLIAAMKSFVVSKFGDEVPGEAKP
jgi:hypothetical protein